MIQVGTQLQVSDNSGAKVVECIKVLSKTRGNFGTVGDLIVVTVKEVTKKQKNKVKKGNVYRAVILETSAEFQRADGSSLKSQRNTAVLLSVQGSPLGTRIQGLASYELRRKNFMKILSLSTANM